MQKELGEMIHAKEDNRSRYHNVETLTLIVSKNGRLSMTPATGAERNQLSVPRWKHSKHILIWPEEFQSSLTFMAELISDLRAVILSSRKSVWFLIRFKLTCLFET